MYAVVVVGGCMDHCLPGCDVTDHNLYKKTPSVLDILGLGSNQMTGFERIYIYHGMRTIYSK